MQHSTRHRRPLSSPSDTPVNVTPTHSEYVEHRCSAPSATQLKTDHRHRAGKSPERRGVGGCRGGTMLQPRPQVSICIQSQLPAGCGAAGARLPCGGRESGQPGSPGPRAPAPRPSLASGRGPAAGCFPGARPPPHPADPAHPFVLEPSPVPTSRMSSNTYASITEAATSAVPHRPAMTPFFPPGPRRGWDGRMGCRLQHARSPPLPAREQEMDCSTPRRVGTYHSSAEDAAAAPVQHRPAPPTTGSAPPAAPSQRLHLLLGSSKAHLSI